MKKLTTSVLVVVLSSAFAVANAQKKDSINDIGTVQFTGAMGIKKKVDAVTNAQQVVTAKELTQASAPSVVQALTGKVSGLIISQTNNSVGASNRIVIRGSKSLTGDNQALVVIDNVISTADVLSQLPPEVIESTNVIKGMQGSALYGERGSNGVIIVTTKKGSRNNKMQFTLSSAVEMSQVFMLPKVQTKYGKGVTGEGVDINGNDPVFEGTSYVPWENTSWGASYNNSTIGGQMLPSGLPQADGSFIYEKYAPVKNHFAKFFKNGVTFQNGVTVNAGGSDSYAMLALNRTDTDFVVAGDNLQVTSILAKAGKKIDRLRVDASINFIHKKINETDSNLYNDLMQMPTMNDIRKYQNSGVDGYLTAFTTNPYYTIQHTRFISNNDYLNGILGLGYEFNPHISVSYTGNLSLSSYQSDNHNDGFTASHIYENTGTVLDGGTLQDYNANTDFTSYYINRTSNTRNYYGDLMVNFNYDLNKDWNLKLNVGNNITDYSSIYRAMGGTGLITPGWYDIRNVSNVFAAQNSSAADKYDNAGFSNYTYRKRTVSGFANLDLAFRDYLYLNATYRLDASSTSGTYIDDTFHLKPYGYYSFGASFIPTKAFAGLRDSKVLTYMKIAPSFTRVGNTSGIAAFALSQVGVIPAGYPYNGLPGYGIQQIQTDRNITPEFVTTKDLNVQLGFFKDRVTLEGSVYQSDTDHLISTIYVSNASGFQRLQSNFGKTRMNGVEFDLGITPIKSNDITWTLHGSYSSSRTKLLELPAGVDSVPLAIPYSTVGIGVFAVKGLDYPVLQATGFQRDAEGHIIVGSNGMPLYNSNFTNMGRVTPDYILGFNTSIKVKGFTLAGTMDYRKGGKFASMTKSTLNFAGLSEESASFDRENGYIVPNSVQIVNGVSVANTTPVTVSGASSPYDSAIQYWTSQTLQKLGEPMVLDATAFKIREISLSYDIPRDVLRSSFLTGATIGVYSRNPFFKYAKGNQNFADPESSYTSGNGAGIAITGQYPSQRMFGMNVKLSF